MYFEIHYGKNIFVLGTGYPLHYKHTSRSLGNTTC